MVPLIGSGSGIPFVKEYNYRQSPMNVYCALLGPVGRPDGWEITDGKCEYTTIAGYPIVAGYPLTSKTLPAREAYFNMWEDIPTFYGGATYDALRFILSDAIRRAGTTETEAVIKALEETSIETTSARNFVFTKSHDTMTGENANNPEEDYTLVLLFQWQNGELVPVYPKKIMEEAGITLTFPHWSGPWDDLQ